MKEDIELNTEEIYLDDNLDFLGNDESSKYKRFYFVKMLIKKNTEPHFEFSRNVAGKVQKVRGTTKSISGTVKKITFGNYTFEGVDIPTVRFLIETLDNQGDLIAMSWGTSYNMISINLFNKILALDKPLSAISIDLFTDRNSGYNQAKILLNGQKVEGLLSPEQRKAMCKEFTIKGKTVKDNEELINYLRDSLKDNLPTILPDFKPEPELSDEEKEHQTIINDKLNNNKVDNMEEFFEFSDNEGDEDPTPAKGRVKTKIK